MYSILFRPTAGAEDEAITELWEQGTTGIVEEAAGLRAYFKEEAAAGGRKRDWVRLFSNTGPKNPGM